MEEMMDIGNLPPELKEKAKACENPEELLELAKAEGIELTEEQLDSVSGGTWGCSDNDIPETCGEHYGKNVR